MNFLLIACLLMLAITCSTMTIDPRYPDHIVSPLVPCTRNGVIEHHPRDAGWMYRCYPENTDHQKNGVSCRTNLGQCIQDGGKLCVPGDGLIPFYSIYVVDSCPNAVQECDDGATSPLCPDDKVYSSKMSMCVDDYKDKSGECYEKINGVDDTKTAFVCYGNLWQKEQQFKNCTNNYVIVSGMYCAEYTENDYHQNQIPFCPNAEHVNLKTRLCEPDYGCDENGDQKWKSLSYADHIGWNCKIFPDCTTSKQVTYCVDKYEFNFGNEEITLREPVPKQNCINATEIMKRTATTTRGLDFPHS